MNFLLEKYYEDLLWNKVYICSAFLQLQNILSL